MYKGFNTTKKKEIGGNINGKQKRERSQYKCKSRKADETCKQLGEHAFKVLEQ